MQTLDYLRRLNAPGARPEDAGSNTDYLLETSRDKILNGLLLGAFAFTIPLVGWTLISDNKYFPLYLITLLVMGFLAFMKSLSFNFKSAALFLVIYANGASSLFTGGTYGIAEIVFLTLICVASVTRGLRAAVIMLIICISTIVIMSYLIVSGHVLVEAHLTQFSDTYVDWIYMPLLILSLSAFLALPIEYLVSNLNSSLQSTQELLSELRTETDAKNEIEKSRRESESRYHVLAENVRDIIWTTDIDLNFTYISPSVERMRGFTQSEALQLGLEGSLPPGTVEMFRGIVQEEIALDESGEADLNRSRVFEVELPHKNGTKINTEIVVSFLRDEQSHAVGVLGVTRDISARKQAEADRERLMSAIEQTSESLLIVDTNGNIQYQNPAYERTTGYSKDDSIGLIARFLSRDSQNQIILDEIWQTLRAGYIWRGQMVNIKKDGSPFTEETSISPIRDPQKEIVGYVIVARDITREKQLEEQLLQTQKIEAVGNLAGGIAHDFNNILTGIYGHAQLALDQIPSTHPANESVQGVIAASDRAAGLVSQILTFSRKSESDYVPVQLENVIDDALKLLRPTLPSTISIKEKLNVPGGMIFADPTQMHQVLLNLCTNAAGAMPTGGILEIILDEEEINSDIQPTLPRGTYVKLVVSDNGEGIEASNLNQIFDLFYTTKPVGKGTGFGLAVVHAIITECKGSISVESVVGEGTTFTILLPKYKSESEEILVEVNAPPTGEERVLLVDDEEMVTQVHKRLLEANGYHVTVTNSSLSAAHIFKTNPEDFDIVITDQTMPDMTGDELSQELQKIRPNIPIILCTGYSEDMDESKAASLGISKFLLKPVTREDLLMTIRAAIDGK